PGGARARQARANDTRPGLAVALDARLRIRNTDNAATRVARSVDADPRRAQADDARCGTAVALDAGVRVGDSDDAAACRARPVDRNVRFASTLYPNVRNGLSNHAASRSRR